MLNMKHDDMIPFDKSHKTVIMIPFVGFSIKQTNHMPKKKLRSCMARKIDLVANPLALYEPQLAKGCHHYKELVQVDYLGKTAK